MPGARPLPANAHHSHETDPDVPSLGKSSQFQNKNMPQQKMVSSPQHPYTAQEH